ncbi:ROK family transcriptional regulator [Pseudonocardia sp. DSM 110487]|uniref:ROK family transcriptional regulator n=1 Tax=Pseudonocardia sp. DSM 110487 TaxID=2865833 RepID=UPI001C6950B2|nr:ROK family transcriptional regulator [Pseudonocardia sp. DSM 110487]QYN38531.1 ROK family transcriptional regulator [Pseudonocardia sp. DSM 110487]
MDPERIVAPSSRMVREASARLVLDRMWHAPVVTGSDLMAATGLSRATVHDVCEELIERGWVREVANQREFGGYQKGRPARRYAFDPQAGLVVGVDAGEHRVGAIVADLRGVELGRHQSLPHGGFGDPAERLDIVGEAITAALAAADVRVRRVLTVTVGVPAPVDAAGRTAFRGNPYWELMNPDIGERLRDRHGWRTIVDNDANLAALAEGWRGHGRGERHFVALLAGERLGAGIVEDGRLLRGVRGGAGEMRFLDLVAGVGSTDGIAKLAREWAREALAEPVARSVLAPDPDAASVFAAATAGDALAAGVVDRIAERMARVIATLASLVDTDQVIIAGRVAASCGSLVSTVQELLARHGDPPPRVLASTLGGDAVMLGAVKRSLDDVREHALQLAVG